MNSKPMPIPFINPALPSTAELATDYEKIHENNFYTNNGPFYYAFVDALEQYIGHGTYCSVVSNATVGLILSLRASCDESKKYVIVPSYTFAATALSSLWAGFEPYFVDVDPETFALDIAQVREVCEKERNNVAAIMLCNPFGIGLDAVDDFEQLSDEFAIPLVLDSAAGFGSKYSDGNIMGSKGNCEVFSFHATKPFSISEGGVVCSRDRDFIDKVEALKNFGFDKDRNVDTIGLNAKLDELSCAIGLRMLPRLDARVEMRQQVFGQYADAFRPFGVEVIPHTQISSLCFASFVIPVTWDKHELMDRYSHEHIEVRDYYNPVLHDMVSFKQFPRTEMKNTYDLSRRVLSLPCSEKLRQEEIDRIITVAAEYGQEVA